MSPISLSILLLCIQPFVIYKAMFCEKEEEEKEDLEFSLSFVVIAPSFIFFYLDTFWYALSLLGCVSLIGGFLVKVCTKKAKRSITLKELYPFMFSWLAIFAIGYGLIDLYHSVVTWITSPKDPINSFSKPLLPNILPSLYFLSAIIITLLIRIIEVNKGLKEELTGFLLLVLSIGAAIAPFFSDYYLLSLVFNFIVLLGCTNAVITYKQTDPSAGAIMFFYSFAFMISAVSSLIVKSITWLLS